MRKARLRELLITVDGERTEALRERIMLQKENVELRRKLLCAQEATDAYSRLTELVNTWFHKEKAYKNHKLWDRINIDNPSLRCLEIGMREAAALGQAASIPKLTDSSQLFEKVVIAHVKVKDGYNDVRTYSAPAQVTHSQPAPQQEQAAPQREQQPTVVEPTAPQQTAKPPWAR